MDEIIESFDFVPFGELNWCFKDGIMYQRDLSRSVEYGKDYFEKYVRYENTDMARKLNKSRNELTAKYCESLVDIGIGSGEFIKSSGIRVFGYDINPVGIRWLRQRRIYVDPYASMPNVGGLTFWDSLEHIPHPSALLKKMRPNMKAFISLPIFNDLTKLRQSKHYRPNEHFYYFSASGLVAYMQRLNFKLLEVSDFETQAGREDILTFVFEQLDLCLD